MARRCLELTLPEFEFSRMSYPQPLPVISAKAEIHVSCCWIPSFEGMTWGKGTGRAGACVIRPFIIRHFRESGNPCFKPAGFPLSGEWRREKGIAAALGPA